MRPHRLVLLLVVTLTLLLCLLHDPVAAAAAAAAAAVDPSTPVSDVERQEIDLMLGSDECRSLIRKKRRAVTQINKKKASLMAPENLNGAMEAILAGTGSPETLAGVLDSRLRQLNSLESLLLAGLGALKEALASTNWETGAVIVDEEMLKKVQLASLGVQEEALKAAQLDAALAATARGASSSSSSSGAGNVSSSGDPELLRDAMSQILGKVAESVDEVEETLDDKAFERATKGKDAHFVTVVTVKEQRGDDGTEGHEERQAVKLIDQQNNQFSLSRPRDTTVPVEDPLLIADGILLAFAAFVLGTLFHLLSLPVFFGHLLAGILLGPSGLNLVTNLVQVETLGQFGVYLILFVLGLEFDEEKLWRHWTSSVWGTGLLMLLDVVFLVLVGVFLGTAFNEAVLIALCVSLSSTAVVLRCLDTAERVSPAGQVLFGVLVVQDVLLGAILAFFPLLESSDAGGGVEALITLFSLLFRMGAFSLLSLLVAKFIAGPFFGFLSETKSAELLMLGATTLCFAILRLSDAFGLSAEVGAFVAGLIASSVPQFLDSIRHSVEPLRDFFSTIFFASIGFHIYPTFLYQQSKRSSPAFSLRNAALSSC